MLHPIVGSINPNPDQEPAITYRDTDIAVTAGAGTGKTLTLVARYVSLLADGLHPRQIAAITFTRKAAREMRNRVRRVINEYLHATISADVERWREYYTALDAARIGTIHSLCSELLRAHPAEAGVDPRFTLLEEAEGAILKMHAVDTALAWLSSHAESGKAFMLFGEQPLRTLLLTLLNDRYGARQILSGLPPDIFRHWQHILVQRQEEVLQDAFLDQRYGQALDVLRSCEPIQADDRMAQQRSMALAATSEGGGARTWQERLFALCQLDAIDLRGGSQRSWPGGKEQLDEVRAALRSLRDWWRKIAPLCTLELNGSDEALAESLPLVHATFEYAAETYRRALHQRRALDFDDLETGALALLHENEDVCARWRSEIRAILVDEYQDTNGRQRDLLNLLNGNQGNLFLVGDAKQSIYRFRGAEIAVFRQERARVARSGKALELSRSYRAHANLVQALNQLLRPVLGTEQTVQHEWEEPFAPLVAMREVANYALEAPFVELHLTCGSKSQGALERAARVLASRLLELREASEGNLRFDHIAVLCRASTSFAAYEDAFDAAAIPYTTVAGRGFFERPEIRDLLNALQVISDPHDDLAFVGFLRSPVTGLHDGELLHLIDAHRATENSSLWRTLSGPGLAADRDVAQSAVNLLATLHQRAGRLTVAEILKFLVDETGYRAALQLAGKIRALHNVDKLQDIAHRTGFVSNSDFLEYIGQLRTGIAREGEARASAENAVQIMSVHQAKGLQFPVVVIGDVSYQSPARGDHYLDEELGLVAKVTAPGYSEAAAFTLAKQRESQQENAESARLLYVAATRAQDKLILNGVTSINNEGQLSGLRGWLQQLDEALELGSAPVNYDQDGVRAHNVPIPGSTGVSCQVYEPGFVPTAGSAPSQAVEEPALPGVTALTAIHPLYTQAVQDNDYESVWRIIPQGDAPAIPPHLLGKLIHDALSSWRFPQTADDPAFLALIEARVRQFGVFDSARLQNAARHAVSLLFRFTQHPFYLTIEQAHRRLHEVPFILSPLDGDADASVALEPFDSGRIDLLYLDDAGWHIVDFKSDSCPDRAALTRRLQAAYLPQLSRYRMGVQRLLGIVPLCHLCLLDFQGNVLVIDPDTWQA